LKVAKLFVDVSDFDAHDSFTRIYACGFQAFMLVVVQVVDQPWL
jgi:hypothetical protein